MKTNTERIAEAQWFAKTMAGISLINGDQRAHSSWTEALDMLTSKTTRKFHSTINNLQGVKQ